MLKSLERAFRDKGDTATRFYLCFLDDDPRPDAAVIRALRTLTTASVFIIALDSIIALPLLVLQVLLVPLRGDGW